ncbi:DUF2065 domain-containing protein [Caldovatus aquaticus]|uniref:DUF2065 domain-containing protein n=1 Tax=Caldovatus aquaticus TaxID=2865671 RepID=A0ABS7F222_9PROT|nr:DUF2065 domain-containing protein [Caldovatus aquaticus]MBW8269539.1 DUF2065 domain-containing protein [Caldovatus aquaticus]
MTVQGLIQAIAVVLAIEGLFYALAPGAMRRALAALSAAPEEQLRTGGLVAAVIGIALAWVLRGAA